MNSVIAELQKRKVFRAVSAYSIACFVFLQLLDVVADALEVTPEHIRWVIAAMLVGLPIVGYLAWVLELSERPVSESRRGSWLGAAAAASAILLLGIGGWWVTTDKAEGPLIATSDIGQKIAVLPLRDISPAGEYGWLADGVATELVRQIDLWDRFDVVPYAMSRNWSSTEASAATNIYIDGSVQASGKDVFVHLEAIDSKARSTLWNRVFRGHSDDIFSLQRELASTTARYFGETAGGIGGPVSPDAYANFLRYLETRNHGDLELESFWLEQTLSIDPTWAAGWASLANAVMRIAGIEQDPKFADPAEQYLRNAQRASNYPSEWLWAQQYYEAYWQRAPLKSLETIRELHDHGDSRGAAYMGARLMLSAGMFEEPEPFLRWHLEQLPFDLYAWELLGVSLVNQGKSTAATVVAERVQSLQRRNEFVATFGPGLAYPRSLQFEKGLALATRYGNSIRAGEYGSVSTKFIEVFGARALGFEMALASSDTQSALQHAEWMLDNDYPVHAGTMLLRLGDSRAETALKKAQTRYFGGFGWAYARIHLGTELQDHAWIIEVDNAFGFTREFRQELCQLAAQVGSEVAWRCELRDYLDNESP